MKNDLHVPQKVRRNTAIDDRVSEFPYNSTEAQVLVKDQLYFH